MKRKSHGHIKRSTLTPTALLLVALGAAGCGGDDNTTTANNAADAAKIGDTVIVRWPASTIMCSDRNDASKVYITGELSMRQSMRLENRDISKALDAETRGQTSAMAQAYSCHWAPSKSGFRYVVTEREIVGDDKSAFHVAAYCLKPLTIDNGDKCWWIEATATMNAQLSRITDPSRAH